MTHPDEEPNAEIRRRLLWLKRLDITTAYPYLMRLYFEYSTEQIPASDFVALLDVLESFIVRRYVCNVPTHGLNKFFSIALLANQGVRVPSEGKGKTRVDLPT